MHSGSKSRMSTGTKIFIIVVIVLVVIGLVIWALTTQISTLTLQVSDVSLNPNEIRLKESATFSFTIKSNDPVKPHSVMVVFNTTSPVTFYQNNVSLLVNNSTGFQYLPIVLQSGQQSTYPLKVTGTLPPGASTSTYTIRIDFYDENSTRFDTETISLKIDQS
jgi:hypothetical protein